MCPRGPEWHFANLTWNHQRISMGVTCKRRHEDQYITITSIEWWFRNYIHNNRCFFRTYHRLSNPTTFNTSKVIIDNMTTHAYLTTLLIPEKSSTSLSHVINEVADFMDFTHRHVTTKHAQTIGANHRKNQRKNQRKIASTKKTSLKLSLNDVRKRWHKIVLQTVLNYNKTYYTSIG